MSFSKLFDQKILSCSLSHKRFMMIAFWIFDDKDGRQSFPMSTEKNDKHYNYYLDKAKVKQDVRDKYVINALHHSKS